MPAMVLKLDGDEAWPDLREKLSTDDLIHLGADAPAIQVAALEGGMASGKPSIAIRLDLPDGRVVVAETSLELFLAAASALRTRFEKGSNGSHN